jgi:leader peptidase (prepilin peptidase)/N-methyltransferase
MHVLTYLAIVKAALIIALVYLTYIDLRTFRLPDVITLSMIAIGILFNVVITPDTGLASPISSLLGAITGFVLLWALDKMYYWAKRQHGIGLGDAKLLSALGAWLGLGAIPNILLIASISGALGGFLWLRFQKQSIGSAFPFGPFLAFAGIIELLWPQLLQALILNSPT